MRAFFLVFEGLCKAVICDANKFGGLLDSWLLQEMADMLKELFRLLGVAMRPASNHFLFHAIQVAPYSINQVLSSSAIFAGNLGRVEVSTQRFPKMSKCGPRKEAHSNY